MLGDEFQLKPDCNSARHENPLCDQIELSLFTRIAGADLSLSALNTQYRMNPRIADMVNTVFYNGRLKTHQSRNVTPAQTIFREWNGREYNVFDAVVFVDVKYSWEESHGTSKANPNQAAATISLVRRLMSTAGPDGGVMAKDIVIISPYQAQLDLYLSLLAEADSVTPKRGFKDIRVANVDSFQGGEAPVVIFDIVRTDDPGFVMSPNRLNVALSRAKDALYFIMSRSSLEGFSNPRGNTRWYVCSMVYSTEFRSYLLTRNDPI